MDKLITITNQQTTTKDVKIIKDLINNKSGDIDIMESVMKKIDNDQENKYTDIKKENWYYLIILNLLI